MKQYLFLGDTHGDLQFASKAIAEARHAQAEIIQLGDWGFYWPGSTKIDALSHALSTSGVTMRFVDGNHDEHPRLRKHVSSCIATTIAPSVIYQPRGSVHEDEDGTRFLFLGGAPSIDRAYRTAGVSWWPEEAITAAEFETALSAPGPFHAIVTHDAPAFPPGFSPKGSASYRREQELSMERVDALVARNRPALLVHGHWHYRYERTHAIGSRVVGLDCNEHPGAAVLSWSRAGETS